MGRPAAAAHRRALCALERSGRPLGRAAGRDPCFSGLGSRETRVSAQTLILAFDITDSLTWIHALHRDSKRSLARLRQNEPIL